MHWLYLAVAVLFETIGTTALQASQQFSRLGPSVVMVASYAVSFYLLALTLRVMPVGVVYAIWSGLGICFIAMIAYFLFGQKLDFPAIVGMVMIIGGIAVINLFSNTTTH
ncbi:small multidrug resistance pump [Salinihabitans flavidus]|uniref:Small multidrug resistance pump n=1 Tax=Salinihabitans flavidus TaxID=569882 RepID=A0A1H8MSR2_9RHOB|nr:multidrug efflux SMR transporter [Salinihabitans flavidus]SEO20290.1 small multidrug resistance pump [Salinihabitans flavidus]